MSYEEAWKLKAGDRVVVRDKKQSHTVEQVSGTYTYLFILLDNGFEYLHTQVEKI